MTTRAPDTLEPAGTWRNAAACREPDIDPEIFFPVGTGPVATKRAEAAKKICHRCPVATQCLQWALDTRQDTGIWGGHTEQARNSARRRAQRTNEAPLQALRALTAPAPSLEDAYARRTKPTSDGHRLWTVTTTSVTVGGLVYTPMRLAFALGHGRPPEGVVRAFCGVTGCVEPAHLTDGRMRWQQQAEAAV